MSESKKPLPARLLKSAGRIALLLGICYALFTLAAPSLANILSYPAPSPSYVALEGGVTLTTSDGQSLSAVWLPAPAGTDHPLTLLYSHGNGEDLGRIFPHLQSLQALGFNVFSYDYRGYGKSTGKPDEEGLYRDIEAAFQYLTQTQAVPSDQIIAFGRSLGGGSASWLAAHHPLGGLVLESTYVSTFKVMLPNLWFPNDQFRTRSRLKEIHCPVLVIHGTEDEVIAFWHGEALFAGANEPKQKLWIEGAGHNNLHSIAGPRYAEALIAFRRLIESQSASPAP